MKKPPVYLPEPYRKGNKIIKKYQEVFEDRVGNIGVVKKVDYINKKGNTISDHVVNIVWVRTDKELHDIYFTEGWDDFYTFSVFKDIYKFYLEGE